MGGQVIICSNLNDYETQRKSSDKERDPFKFLIDLVQPIQTVVFFTAPWSGPAQKISTTVKDLAEEYPNVKVLQLDMRHFKSVAQDLKVTGAPTFVFRKNAEDVAMLYTPKPSELYEEIKKL